MARRRWSVDEVLHDPRCKRILDQLAIENEASMSALRGELRIGWSALYSSLGKLERAGLISIERGRPNRVLRTGAPVRPRLSRTSERIARALVMGQASTVAEICARSGLARSTVYHELPRLLHAGLVSFERTRPYDGLRPSPELAGMLRT